MGKDEAIQELIEIMHNNNVNITINLGHSKDECFDIRFSNLFIRQNEALALAIKALTKPEWIRTEDTPLPRAGKYLCTLADESTGTYYFRVKGQEGIKENGWYDESGIRVNVVAYYILPQKCLLSNEDLKYAKEVFKNKFLLKKKKA